MKLPKNLRLLDYIVFFVVVAGLGILNIMSPGPWLAPVILSIAAGIGASLILGTFTNVVFRRHRK